MTKRQRKENVWAYIFLGPQLIGFAAFVAFPMVFSIYLCLSSWDFVNAPVYAGMLNIEAVFRDPIFWKSMGNTFIYIALTVPVTLFISLSLALLGNRPLALKKFVRAAFFLPMVTSTVAISMVWMFIYQPYGILNSFLEIFSIKPINWLQETGSARVAVSIITIWLKLGYYYIIFDAGLKNIPADLYEAAELDGASSFVKTKSITLPMLSSVAFFVLVMLFIDVFNMFNEIYIMTQGGPDYSTYTLSMYIYFYAFNQFDMGRAAVASWMLFILIAIVTAVQFGVKKKVVYE